MVAESVILAANEADCWLSGKKDSYFKPFDDKQMTAESYQEPFDLFSDEPDFFSD